MKVDLTDIKALENREVEKRVPVDLVTFDSKLGKFPITKKAYSFLSNNSYPASLNWKK